MIPSEMYSAAGIVPVIRCMIFGLMANVPPHTRRSESWELASKAIKYQLLHCSFDLLVSPRQCLLKLAYKPMLCSARNKVW